MLTLQHQFSIVEQRDDDDRARMGDVFSYSYFAIRHTGSILINMQEIAIKHVQATDWYLGEIGRRWLGHYDSLNKLVLLTPVLADSGTLGGFNLISGSCGDSPQKVKVK
jgi:hypothetical protein